MSLAEIRNPAARFLRRPEPWTVYGALTLVLTGLILAALATGISEWHVGVVLALPLFLIMALWISGGAATALLGLTARPSRRDPGAEDWSPVARTAILVALCKEEPDPVARYLAGLRAALDRSGIGAQVEICVLSDTSGAQEIEAEAAAFSSLAAIPGMRYRRRALNTGQKPGNIADWYETEGNSFDLMVVLDADSRMSVARIADMIRRMEQSPRLGLLQAGIAIAPGRTRFGRHQRNGARLLSGNFGRGFAAWTGDHGNYWGHNAIIRTAAFRVAARLPRLPGAAPFGGDLLSHDFIEAAWIRRAGWAVALDPRSCGSAETAPQTLDAYHRRDRRWCQGNLQHLRLLGTPGLSPISRLHLVSGVLSYLVAPAWLLVMVLIILGIVTVQGALPLLAVLSVLALPKLCALIDWLARARTPWRRGVVLRAWAVELVVSTLVAPLVMLRQVGSVLSVCLGRDCGWKTPRAARMPFPAGGAEAVIGLTLVWLAWTTSGAAALWLAPVAVPLCAAPFLIRVLDAPAR